MLKLSNLTILVCMLLVAACTLGSKKNGLKKRNLDQYYQSSGVVNYFLSELPDWANYSETGRCNRTIRVKYLHMQNMMESFGLNYDQLVQFQYLFNKEYIKKQKAFKSDHLYLKNEEGLFYDVLDKIKANIFAFRRPKFKRVNLVWVDSYLDDEKGHKKLQALFKKKSMLLGHPVIISMCRDYYTLKELLRNLKLDKYSIKIIPAEMFSIFKEDGAREYYFSLNVEGLFKAKQEIYFYTPKGVKPKEIKGKFKIKKL